MRDPGPDDYLNDDAFESTSPAERPTRPGPAPEPTNSDILDAIERVALSIARVESAMEFMRLTVVSHGHQIATLEAKINNVEARVANLEARSG